MHVIRLNAEETYLLERAKLNGYVTTDRREQDDAVVNAYQYWCRAERLPFLAIALDDDTSRVTFSLIEADSLFDAETEDLLRAQLPTFCLYDGEIVIEDDFCIAPRVCNDQLPNLLIWLHQLSTSPFPAFV